MTAPNFIGGLEQEVYRMQEDTYGKLGDPNTYANQQIRQNQAFLGSIQNIGALQDNQMQQLQALKQMQEIQRVAEEERINRILYPVNDGRGGSFFANLRQLEGLKTVQAYNQQLLAQENLQNQTQLNSLKTAEAVDKYKAERQITPKLMDFKAKVADLTARIRSGGEDGALAFRELETMRIDPSSYQYMDESGMAYSSPEGSAGFEAVLDSARKEARTTSVYQMKEKVLSEFYDAQDRMDKVLELQGQLKPGEYEQAWELRNRIRKAAMSMDMNKPDPEAIGALVLETKKFNLEGMQKTKDVVDNTEAAKSSGMPISKVSSGPKGAEVEAEMPRASGNTGDTVAGRLTIKDKEAADKLMEEIIDLRGKIEMLKGKQSKEDPAPELKDENGKNSYTQQDLEKILSEKEKAYEERIRRNPALGTDDTAESVRRARSPQGVPNVLSTNAPSAFRPLPTGQVNAPSVVLPGKTTPILKLKLTRQADGSLNGTFVSPGSTSTNTTAKPK